jgi:hypothetical protein
MVYLTRGMEVLKDAVFRELYRLEGEILLLRDDLGFWKKVALVAGIANLGWLGYFAWLVTRV